MNVYFVPLAGGRYEPYFEHEEPGDDPVGPEPPGFFARMRARFSAMVREAERQRHEPSDEAPATLMDRLQRRVMGWIAAQVAEQRVLWHLRSADRAELHVPDTLDPDEALRLMREELKRDADSHRRRLVLHALGLIASAPLALVPGPNVLAYFFTFGVVAHFLSYRGARRGLDVVQWTVTPSPPLTTIGRALITATPERTRLIHEAAELLRLAHLPRFVERMSAPPA